MTWDIEKILERFAFFAGISREEAQRQRILCEDATAQVEGMAKTVPTSAEEATLYGAAAALAFYRWAVLEDAREPENFSAGELTIRRGNDMAEKARKVWLEYRRAASSCIEDPDFMFCSLEDPISYRRKEGRTVRL